MGGVRLCLLSSSSFTAFLDGLDYIKLVAARDRQIADAVRSSRDEVGRGGPVLR